jgi:hypothetical protein
MNPLCITGFLFLLILALHHWSEGTHSSCSGYTPQNIQRADIFRKIEVKVSAQGHGSLRVRTRPGYSLAAHLGSGTK